VITLTNGGYTIVDEDLFPELNKFKWRRDNNGSVARYERPTGGKLKCIMLHRVVNQTPDGFHTDHINGERQLDNRRQNLRTVTRRQNHMNMRKGSNREFASKYKGVTWYKKLGKWVARIKLATGWTYLGAFVDEKDAALAYNTAARLHFGEYAKLNQI